MFGILTLKKGGQHICFTIMSKYATLFLIFRIHLGTSMIQKASQFYFPELFSVYFLIFTCFL